MLNFYITQTQRLLHDTSAQFWPTTELTDYINEARNRIAQDTHCLRQLVTSISLTAQTEVYSPQTLLGAVGSQYIDTHGITLYWGSERIKLNFWPFTRFDAKYRRYVPYFMRPIAFSKIGANLIYFGPNPDQAYVTDWDVSVIPNALVTDATPEQIPVPFQEPVQYYAAYKAKWKEQAMGEAAIFEKQYWKTLSINLRAFNAWRVNNPYRIGA